MLELLLTADPDIDRVTAYIPGENTIAVSLNNALVGIAVVIIDKNNSVELKNIAVVNGYQGQGIGKRLIEKAKGAAKKIGAKELWVGTGNSSLSELAFYQKCGFRIEKIKPNYFLNYQPPIIENGIRCLDMVMLKASW